MKAMTASLRLLICAILVLPTAVISVAPHAGQDAKPLTPELVAFLAAGGTLDDICGAKSGELGPHCPDCLMPALPAAPGPDSGARRVRFTDTAYEFGTSVRMAQARDPVRCVRAPPQDGRHDLNRAVV